MAFIFNGKTIGADYTIKFNNSPVKKIVYNGKTVWEPYLYLYNNGNECINVHGGFVSNTHCGFGRGGTGAWVQEPEILRWANTIQFKGHVNNYGSVFAKNKINVTDYNKMVVVITDISYGGTGRIGFTPECKNGYNGPWVEVPPETHTITSLTLDISALAGDYYFAMELDGTKYVTISQIYLY